MRTLIIPGLLLLQLMGCAQRVTPPNTPKPFSHNVYKAAVPVTVGPPSQIPALVLSGSNALYLYDASGRQMGTIAMSEAQGAVDFDRQGNIYYDSYQQYSYHVLIFAPPYTGKPREVSFKGLGYARGITVDWKTGVFAVATDAYAPYPKYHSAMWFFRHGETKPCAGIKKPSSWAWTSTGSFDAEGTLFAVGSSGPGNVVISVSGQCGAKSAVSYKPNISKLLRFQFNTKDELVIDQSVGYGGPIVTYPHPANGQIGNAISKTIIKDIDGKPANMLTLTSEGGKFGHRLSTALTASMRTRRAGPQQRSLTKCILEAARFTRLSGLSAALRHKVP